MMTRRGSFAVLSLLALGACTREPQQFLPPATPPSIVSFSASATAIKPGESVTLTFEAKNATTTEILDQAGQQIAFEGEPNAGTAQVSPKENSFYVLRVTGDGGRDSAFVRVTVAGTLEKATLVAVPNKIAPGGEVMLLWSAVDASSVTLQEGASGTPEQLPAAEGSGMVVKKPSVSTMYTLLAHAPSLQEPLAVTTEVEVGAVLADADVQPRRVSLMGTLEFTVDAPGATSFTISERTLGQVGGGTIDPATHTGSFSYTLDENLPSGDPMIEGTALVFTLSINTGESRTLSVQVGQKPAFETLTAPEFVTAGDGFSISWKTLGASILRIKRGGLVVYQISSITSPEVAEGSWTAPVPTQDITYEVELEDSEKNTHSEPVEVKVVPEPRVVLTPSDLPASNTYRLAWSATNAVSVKLSYENGPSLGSWAGLTTTANDFVDVSLATDATVVAEAVNAAGSTYRTTAVVDAAAISGIIAEVQPTPALGGAPVTVKIDLTSQALTYDAILGVPMDPVESTDPAQNNFYDLAAVPGLMPIDFGANTNDGLVELTDISGFRFKTFDGSLERIFVSTNGFVSFEDQGPQPTNVDLTQTGNIQGIAPFWDDLRPSADPASGVYYLVEGMSFPRNLIIQWNKMTFGFDDTGMVASLTFQVHISETGVVKFFYEDLSPAGLVGVGGEGATIGVNLGAYQKQLSTEGTATVSNDKSVRFFEAGNTALELPYSATQAGAVSFFARKVNGLASTDFTAFVLPVRIINIGDITISEVMPVSAGQVPTEQWIELSNNTSSKIDLGGLRLTSSEATSTDYAFAAGTEIEAGGQIVIAQDSAGAQANGIPAAKIKGEFKNTLVLGSASTLKLMLDTHELSELTWSAPTAGHSVAQVSDVIDSTGARVACAEETEYSTGSYGSPGTANRTCFEYTLTPTTYAFEDISPFAEPLVSTSWDDQVPTVDVSASPILFFGTRETSVRFSANGGIVPGWETRLSTTYRWGSGESTNYTTPSTTTPDAAVVPFGDDLYYTSISGSNIYAMYLPPGANPSIPEGHWIFQWHHATPFYSDVDDDMSFQVKFFDSGAIEFHYAQLIVNDTVNNYAIGEGATSWLESRSGDTALAINLADGRLRPFTAFRFTPVTP